MFSQKKWFVLFAVLFLGVAAHMFAPESFVRTANAETKWTEMQVALPDKMVSLSSLIKDSFSGQGYDTSNTVAFISRAMKTDGFIYRIEQNLFKTIENNDW